MRRIAVIVFLILGYYILVEAAENIVFQESEFSSTSARRSYYLRAYI